tara:strand:- start:20881 stop:21129 length:249 start_codon:yes stop_codon:yes gene_type:complete
MNSEEIIIDAVERSLDCTDCLHCRKNKHPDDLSIKNTFLDDSCYHPDIMQVTYYGGKQSVQMPSEFLCNRFEEFNDNQGDSK